jgi:hypothetical protein
MATLRASLYLTLTNARQAEGTPQRRALDDRLLLEITQLKSGDVQISLERTDEAPTDQEWARIVRGWPEVVPAGVVPIRRKEGRRYLMVARWPRPLVSLLTPAAEPENPEAAA